MIKIDRYSKVYTENVIDPLLSFDYDQTWTVSSGTGSVGLDNTHVFNGEDSLNIENTAPTTDITVTNSVQSTITNLKTGATSFLFYLWKDDSGNDYEVDVKIYKDAVLLDTQTAIIEDDAEWIGFVSDTEYTIAKGEAITFTFTFKGDAGFVGAKNVWIDGLMLYQKKELVPPLYVRPKDTLDSVVRAGATTDEDVAFGDVTTTQLKLSALNTAPSSASDTGALGEIRIDADYIYVCTATDTWKRVAIATW